VAVLDAAERSYWSPAELAAAGERRGWSRVLQALAPEEDPADFVLDAHPVAVLSAEERALLGELIDARFIHPPTRVTSGRLSAWLRSRLVRLADGIRRWRPWPGAAATLRPEDLSEAERLFVEAMRSADMPDVRLCHGAGPVRRRGRVWYAPRRNRLVRQCVEAVATDQALLYPALLALMGAMAMPPAGVRSRWLGAPLTTSRGEL